MTGSRLKRMGTAKGWPDFIINLPGGSIGYIEVKAAKGRLSPEQAAFRDTVVTNGARWALCHDTLEVETVLSKWLDGSGLGLRAKSSFVPVGKALQSAAADLPANVREAINAGR